MFQLSFEPFQEPGINQFGNPGNYGEGISPLNGGGGGGAGSGGPVTNQTGNGGDGISISPLSSSFFSPSFPSSIVTALGLPTGSPGYTYFAGGGGGGARDDGSGLPGGIGGGGSGARDPGGTASTAGTSGRGGGGGGGAEDSGQQPSSTGGKGCFIIRWKV